MKKQAKNRVSAFVITCACALLGAAGGAAVFAKTEAARLLLARPEIKITLAGAVRRGQAELPVEKAGAVGSGEVVRWKIVSSNVGDGVAQEFKTIGQIPTGTVFVEGSASADGSAHVTYSIDGGKTFTGTPKVSEKQADGTTKQVAAPVSMYTQVRYEWTDSLAAGGKRTASYQVRVR